MRANVALVLFLYSQYIKTSSRVETVVYGTYDDKENNLSALVMSRVEVSSMTFPGIGK